MFVCPQTKIALQLYQVDHKSCLLDYKSLPSPDDYVESASGRSSRISSANSSFSSLRDAGSGDAPGSTGSHHTLEFLEMCSNLIIALAC